MPTQVQSTVRLRSSLLPRRSDPTTGPAGATRVPGRVRRALAAAEQSVPVAADYRGFTIDGLAAAVANLQSQGLPGDTQLVAKVGEHPIDAEVPDAHLVAILALRAEPATEAPE